MSDVIDLAEARKRRDDAGYTNPILEALDALGLALAEHGHTWTDKEADLYERAVAYLGGGYWPRLGPIHEE